MLTSELFQESEFEFPLLKDLKKSDQWERLLERS